MSGPHYFNQPTLSLVGSREVLLVDGDDVVFLVRACSFNGTLQKPVIRLVGAGVLIVGGEGDRREDEATITLNPRDQALHLVGVEGVWVIQTYLLESVPVFGEHGG